MLKTLRRSKSELHVFRGWLVRIAGNGLGSRSQGLSKGTPELHVLWAEGRAVGERPQRFGEGRLIEESETAADDWSCRVQGVS